jgi:hypothetical protein
VEKQDYITKETGGYIVISMQKDMNLHMANSDKMANISLHSPVKFCTPKAEDVTT